MFFLPPSPSTGFLNGEANARDREDMAVDGRSGPNKHHDMGSGRRALEMYLYEYRNAWDGRWKQVYIYSARIYEIGDQILWNQSVAPLEVLGYVAIWYGLVWRRVSI